MAVKKIDIEEFIALSANTPVIDVRSPGEYLHAHFPGAASLPLFSDEERKIIGTAYKQESREIAIKKGLDFFGPKMKTIVEEAETIIKSSVESRRSILVTCWRGGMRSGAIAWLLDLYGFRVYQLVGGYKSFRNWVLKSFEKRYDLNVLGGYTGSGKTNILGELKRLGHNVIDLEALANHKGSAFGGLGEKAQPSQEMFENLLALNLEKNKVDSISAWIEDESQRIGRVMLPKNLWEQMRSAKVYFLDIKFEERLDHILTCYGKFPQDELINSIIRISKRLGGLDTKNAINFLIEKDVKNCFRILLNYYDKLYFKGLNNRQELSSLLTKINCKTVNASENTSLLLNSISIPTNGSSN